MIPSIIDGSLMRATPPALRMSAGTRSSAITATAPASSAILACSGVTTSMMTPPLSIWARPFLVAQVDVSTVMWDGFLWWSRSVRRPGLAPGSSPVRVGRAPRACRLSHERPRALPRGVRRVSVSRCRSGSASRPPGRRTSRTPGPAAAPTGRPRPSSPALGLVALASRYLAYAAEDGVRTAASGGASELAAMPSTITTSSPNSTWIGQARVGAQVALPARRAALDVPAIVDPGTPRSGSACGRPSGRSSRASRPAPARGARCPATRAGSRRSTRGCRSRGRCGRSAGVGSPRRVLVSVLTRRSGRRRT